MLLRLAEELYLLGHDDVGRAAVHLDNIATGLAAAQLTDLVLYGGVGVVQGRLVAAEPAPIGAPDLDALLGAIVGSSPPPDLRAGLAGLAGAATCDRIRDRLLAAGVLRPVTQRRLGLLPVTRYPVVDPATNRAVRVRVWYAAHGRTQPDPDTAALCGLVRAVLLHDHVFADMPLTGLAARLDQITAAQPAALREIAAVAAELVSSRAASIYR